jgi:hypothetical protein
MTTSMVTRRQVRTAAKGRSSADAGRKIVKSGCPIPQELNESTKIEGYC